MSIEAEVVNVARPGDAINVLVVFRQDGIDLTKEVMVFSGDITSDGLIQAITTRGERLIALETGEDVARALVGQKIPINAAPPPPPPVVIGPVV